jgi:hypothetical protein
MQGMAGIGEGRDALLDIGANVGRKGDAVDQGGMHGWRL